MNILNTESRIPGGFTKANAEKLGEASALGGPNQEFIVVAYLSSPIQLGVQRPFWNQYVAFVDGTKVTGSIDYEWTVRFKKSDGSTVTTLTYGSTPAIRVSEQNFADPHIVLQAATVEVSLKIPSISTNTVTLVQHIQGLAQNIENFISAAYTDNAPIAKAGKPDVTREVANTVKDYLIEAGHAFGKELQIPANLPAAVAYTNIRVETPHLLDNKSLAKSLIAPTLFSYDFDAYGSPHVGVCHLKPHYLAMFLPTSATTDINNFNSNHRPAYSTYINFQVIDGDSVTEKDVYEAYAALSLDDRIDIYNLLRFPRSNIRMCAFLLNQLKQTHATWAGLKKEQLKQQRACVKTIISEALRGPRGSDTYTNGLGRRLAAIAYSPFIQAILEAQPSSIQYEPVRIKVLDVRSGRAIKAAKVKKVIIRSTRISGGQEIIHTIGDQEFSYSPSDLSGLEWEEQVQYALQELGFDPGTIDGDLTSAGTITQYGNYWNSRIIDGSFDVNARDQDGNLPVEFLQYILDEYLTHRITDQYGVLHLRIPTNLLHNRKLRIEVGFWEFPVTVEMLKHQLSTTRLTRDTDYPHVPQDTHFTVSWIDNQNAGWNAGNPDAEHFGWQVRNPANNTFINLKVNEILTVKSQTSGTVIQSNIISRFHDPIAYPYQFVLFGMQWCQPVWQELPDHWIWGMVHPSTGMAPHGREEIDQDQKFAPAICTRYNSGSSLSRGRGRDYGIMVQGKYNTGDAHFRVLDEDINHPELIINASYTGYNFTHYASGRAPRTGSGWVGTNKAHRGIDYYAIAGQTPVFAFHAGKVSWRELNGGGLGEVVQIKFGDYAFTCAHLHHNSPTVSLNEWVLPGYRIGYAGRTSSGASPYSSGPTHLHLEISGSNWNRRLAFPPEIVQKSDSEHLTNREIFLGNNSYRLFPCDCDWPSVVNGNANTWDASQCAIRGGAHTHVASSCWASRNLHCPYLDIDSIQFIQAQLTSLQEGENNSTAPYLPTGDNNLFNDLDTDAPYLPTAASDNFKIDGDWGSNAQNAMRRFRWKHREYIYPAGELPATENDCAATSPIGTSPDPLDPDINLEATRTELNRATFVQLVNNTYQRTNFQREEQ